MLKLSIQPPLLFALLLAPQLANTAAHNAPCQPREWNKRNTFTPGEVVCRYTLNPGAEVNPSTCKELANRFDILLATFFKPNPRVDENCGNVLPKTGRYCVAGYIAQPLAWDGRCGPAHNDATCKSTEKQCCNSETWTCGDTLEDCREGKCYEGACYGADIYAIDGNCGRQNGGLKCGGKWGGCCNDEGICGDGPEFCAQGRCQSGDCVLPPPLPVFEPPEEPWEYGNTTDGRCGGPQGLVCGPVFGYCCGADGVCGGDAAHCGIGCQEEFGRCGQDAAGAR